MTQALLLENVSAGYGAVNVLRDITLSLTGTECLAVLGPNGSGKSTLAKTAMGISTLHQGTVSWNGHDISRHPTWRRTRAGIAYVPQTDTAFARLSVQENLLLAGARLGRRELRTRLEDTFDLFPRLAERRRVAAGQLSGGERRMLGLASALVTAPRMLLLDEPTSDLAPAVIDTLFERIELIRERLKLPTMLIEQNVPRALELANRIVVLVAGEVALDQPAKNLTEDEIWNVFIQHV
jgi:ABC-type branched-subunit amino acid transport system ATPase component